MIDATKVNHLFRPHVAALLVLLLAACGGDSADTNAGGGWAGTVDTLANGAVLVSNPEQGMWSDEQAWQLVEELRVGSADVEGPELFGEVTALAVDSLGRIYVADNHAHAVQVFDAGGNHIRTIGRQGAGPGEFEQIAALEWGPDGNLWALDYPNTRFTVYDTAGTFVTSHRRQGGFMMMPWPGRFDEQGRLYDIGFTPGEGGNDSRFLLIRHDAERQPRDTLVIPSYESEGFDHTSEDGRSRMRASIPFAPSRTWRLDPDGSISSGITDRYRIVRESFEGDTLQIIEREHAPARVSAAERDEAVEGLEWFTNQGGKVDPSRIPNTKPAFGMLFSDQDGYLWVATQLAEEEGDAWDLFEPEGRYLGRVTRPEGLQIYPRPVIHGSRMYAVVEDELEVPYVVRYRIVGRDVG